MFRRSTIAAFVSALLLVAPSAALAQSAGDDQYQDPLGGSGGNSGGSNSGSGSNAGGSSSGSAPSATPAPTPATPANSAAAPATSTASPKTLPRTGGEPLLVAFLGGALLITGTGMRLIAPRRG